MDKRDHGGNIHELSQQRVNQNPEAKILDFSANINPLGFPDILRPLVSSHLDDILHYPDQEYTVLRKSIADKFNIPIEFVWPGNGASELIFHLPRVKSFEKCIIPVPCYTDYLYAAQSIRLPVVTEALNRESSFSLDMERLESLLDASSNILFIGQPSNPVGTITAHEDIINCANKFPDTLFCIDESFADYIADYKSLIHNLTPNIAVIRSLTKIYAVPGLRLGYVIANPDIIAKLRSLLPTWSVNSLAAAIGPELLKETDYIEKTLVIIKDERKKLFDNLSKYQSFLPYPSHANYMTVEIKNNNFDAGILAEQLLHKNIAIRCLSSIPGLGRNYFRIAVRTAKENDLLLQAIKETDPDNFSTPKQNLNNTIYKKAKKQKKPLMILGTGSNAGKSIITAAFCRIFYNDGIKVAPFKAQNMSLNSYVTKDNKEMGRAQVLQAQACKLEPDVRMNPILLKPNSHTGSQVIVMGKATENMKASDYYRKKQELWQDVKKAYDSLSADYELIVLEGAGSPAEINLKKNDIVNMKMAAYAEAATLLVGDIDRGGVYASFFGTMELLTYTERKLITGYIVNKFRGDASLLGFAHDYLLKYTGKPVIGVIPMIHDLMLPEEDSVSFKEDFTFRKTNTEAVIDKCVIIVVDFPHISNFTDIDALKREKDVSIQIIRSAKNIPEHWDLFILPGSKNVISDLHFLKTSGIAEYLVKISNKIKGEIIGICGGFQMLGNTVCDPENIESNVTKAQGLSLLNMNTTFMKDKFLKQTKATHIPTKIDITGYEIHHGETVPDDLKAIIKDDENRIIGYSNESGKIWGTYLHGLFDNDALRNRILNRYRRNQRNADSAVFSLDEEIDRLANIVRQHVDMNKIYKELGL